MGENKRATRDGFGDAILEIGKTNPDIYVVDIDIGKSCKTGAFSKELPAQHVNVGIAEQNAVFGCLRMGEQIRQEVCYPNLNVKIACSHGGVTPANDGASHQSIEDMGVYRTIPNMTVMMPADYYAAKALVKEAANTYGPMYPRFTRDAVPVIYDENTKFEIGKAKRLTEGRDVAMIAIGDTVHLALEAQKELEKAGISARVLDMHTLKPLDEKAVLDCVRDIGRIITVEDHNILNGLGSAVCEIAAEAGDAKVKRVGIQDQFGMSAPYERLLEINGITVEHLVALAKQEW